MKILIVQIILALILIIFFLTLLSGNSFKLYQELGSNLPFLKRMWFSTKTFLAIVSFYTLLYILIMVLIPKLFK